MGIYEGYSFFRARKGLLIIGDWRIGESERILDSSGASIKVTRTEYGVAQLGDEGITVIALAKNLKGEERVKTVLHELIHFSNSYRNLRLNMDENSESAQFELNYLENAIEKEMQEVYVLQPSLTRSIERKIALLYAKKEPLLL